MGIQSELESNFDSTIVDDFFDHYGMMVEITERLAIDLGHDRFYYRSIDELFRIFHNIKSASSYLQIQPMIRMSTYVEDVLEQLRVRNCVVNDETIAWLMRIADLFLQWKEDMRTDKNLTRIPFSLLILPDIESK